MGFPMVYDMPIRNEVFGHFRALTWIFEHGQKQVGQVKLFWILKHSTGGG